MEERRGNKQFKLKLDKIKINFEIWVCDFYL